MIRRKYFPYILVALVAVMLLISQWQSLSTTPVDSSYTDHIEISGFSQQQYDENGRRVHQVAAAKAVLDDARVELVQPQMITEHQQVEWQVSAQKAISHDRLNSIRFQQSVSIQSPQQAALSLTTEALNYSATEQRLFNQKPTLLRDQFHQLKANGVNIDLTNFDVELTNGVEGNAHDS
ncbi:MAG: LPS export ABC transporter periplasmic protein LptC [Gammaproteobacteria bacterium]|nr:LPS export ABC transporter periplasmic protein LptC [Gammaproteobacteria bacterium]NVK87218.1 LPS export ABC transporter periplasmic protein LptC [Gammaproteobacteria bacterium]